MTAIGSPLALGTALLFYFGWRRSEAQAEALGFDVSVLGMSPQDFMLRSIPVLFFPVAPSPRWSRCCCSADRAAGPRRRRGVGRTGRGRRGAPHRDDGATRVEFSR